MLLVFATHLFVIYFTSTYYFFYFEYFPVLFCFNSQFVYTLFTMHAHHIHMTFRVISTAAAAEKLSDWLMHNLFEDAGFVICRLDIRRFNIELGDTS